MASPAFIAFHRDLLIDAYPPANDRDAARVEQAAALQAHFETCLAHAYSLPLSDPLHGHYRRQAQRFLASALRIETALARRRGSRKISKMTIGPSKPFKTNNRLFESSRYTEDGLPIRSLS